MRRPPLPALIAACGFVLVGAGGILLIGPGDRGAPAPVTQPPSESPAPSPSAVPSQAGDVLPLALPPIPSPIPAAPWKMHGLSLPAKAPANDRAAGPIIAIGRIEIPRINLRHTVYEGVTLTVVDHGPGHWPGSAMPGDPGNSVFAGHRTVNDHPFGDLDRLRPGDEVIFRVGGRTATYQVTKNFVVDGSNTDIALPTPEATVTLFACHPKGSAKQRIVVQGKLVSAAPA